MSRWMIVATAGVFAVMLAGCKDSPKPADTEVDTGVTNIHQPAIHEAIKDAGSRSASAAKSTSTDSSDKTDTSAEPKASTDKKSDLPALPGSGKGGALPALPD